MASSLFHSKHKTHLFHKFSHNRLFVPHPLTQSASWRVGGLLDSQCYFLAVPLAPVFYGFQGSFHPLADSIKVWFKTHRIDAFNTKISKMCSAGLIPMLHAQSPHGLRSLDPLLPSDKSHPALHGLITEQVISVLLIFVLIFSCFSCILLSHFSSAVRANIGLLTMVAQVSSSHNSSM